MKPVTGRSVPEDVETRTLSPAEALRVVRKAESEAGDRVNQVLARRFPKGAKVSWEYQDTVQHGRVVYVQGWPGFNPAHSIKVHNDRTGKDVWTTAFSIVGGGRS